MKRLALAVTLVLLAGCGVEHLDQGAPRRTQDTYTERSYDSEYGVVCYRYATSSNNLSCVKVN